VRRLYTFNTGNGARHDLVEDVVGTLQGLLGDDTGLLQQICNVESIMLESKSLRFSKGKWKLTGLNISTSQFTSGAEVDTDEFTLGY